MDTIDSILNADDLIPGSFGAVEKGIGYTTLFLAAVPVLLLPFLFAFVKRSVLKLTALLLFSFLLLFLVLRFRFSWIVWLDNRLRPYYRHA